jgi:putative flippase GtrA
LSWAAVALSGAHRVFRFGVVGVAGFIVDSGLTLVLASTAGPILARLPAFLIASSLTHYLNRRWTFGVSARSGFTRSWGKYVVCTAFGALVNLASYSAVLLFIAPTAAGILFAVAFASLVAFVFNFTASERLVFASPERDAPSEGGIAPRTPAE